MTLHNKIHCMRFSLLPDLLLCPSLQTHAAQLVIFINTQKSISKVKNSEAFWEIFSTVWFSRVTEDWYQYHVCVLGAAVRASVDQKKTVSQALHTNSWSSLLKMLAQNCDWYFLNMQDVAQRGVSGHIFSLWAEPGKLVSFCFQTSSLASSILNTDTWD